MRCISGFFGYGGPLWLLAEMTIVLVNFHHESWPQECMPVGQVQGQQMEPGMGMEALFLM